MRMDNVTTSCVRGGVSLLAALAIALGALAPVPAVAQDQHAFKIAAVKYRGGGDWYQGRTPLPNLLAYVRDHTLLDVAPEADVVELDSPKLFTYPFVFLSGHGNIEFSDREVRALRRYLSGGGFLYVDDDYGLDDYLRREMRKVFPEAEWVELPFDHPIYHAHYAFDGGLPKIHAHDERPPQGLGLRHEGRLVAFYSFETNISDGWESAEVHGNPPEKREAALRMGTNILAYALLH